MPGLDRNESPYPPPEAVLAAGFRALTDSRRYPSWDAYDLRRLLADRFGVEPEWVVAGSGSVSVIQRAILLAGPGDVVFSWPSFDAFPPLAAALRRGIELAGLRADGSCDLDDIQARIGPTTRLVIICSPNTPTGGVVDHEELTEFVAAVPPGVLVLIDEAYAEFVTGSQGIRAIDLVRAHPHVMMTRTFSKAYALAGLRVGYGIAQPDLARRIAALDVPYMLTRVGEAAAIEALSHTDHMRCNVGRINAERARLAEGLRALGVDVLAGHGNFVWLPMAVDVRPIARTLADLGVLVKPYPRLGIRVSVGTPEDTDRILSSWPSLAVDTAPAREVTPVSARQSQALPASCPT